MFRAKLLGVVLVAGLVSLGLVVSQVANAAEYVSDANTVLLMHFNEGSGQEVYDASSYMNDGYRGGGSYLHPDGRVGSYPGPDDPDWTTGKYSGGLDFIPRAFYLPDVVDVIGNINVGSISLEMVNVLTMECWFSPDANLGGGLVDPDGYGVLMTYFTDGGAPTQYQITYVGVASGYGAVNGTIAITIGMAGGGSTNVLTTTNSWTAGTWYHIAGVYDGSTLKVYVDGVLEASVPASGNLVDIPITPIPLFRVGGNPTPWFGWKGKIDEVRISKVARTAAEIAYGADALAPVAVASVTSSAIEATGVLTNVSAYLNCAGSNDPDGGDVTCVFVPVSLALGTTPVTLTVTDDEGDTATATVNVTVVDTTPPTITAGLVPVGGSQSEYEVVATATDLVDPNPNVIVTLGVAVEDGQRVNLPPGEGRGHFLIKGATEGVLTVVATDASGKSSVVEVPITR